MKHFVVFPSAKPERALECVKAWAARGYEHFVILFNDREDWATFNRGYDPKSIKLDLLEMVCDQDWLKPFPGYYRVINWMVRWAFNPVIGADLVTCIGDDMLPDPNATASDIAGMYFKRFPDGYGILQPCGDPQGVDKSGRSAAARICGSPVFGRGWFERGYGGRGPFNASYRSFYADEDLKETAERLGVLWHEPSLSFFHKHWSWGHSKREDYHRTAQKNWLEDKALFEKRQQEGFPELE